MSAAVRAGRMGGRRFDQWPELDQRLWEKAHHRGASLLDLGAATSWRDATRVGVEKTWGIFLAFLDGTGELDPRLPPSARTTPERFLRFIQAQQALSNRNTSIVERCYELRMALNVMEPDESDALRWIVAPGGRPIGEWLPGRPARKLVPDASVLAQWARDLMVQRDCVADPMSKARMLRDGLIIGVLAERAPRVNSLSRMELGEHVTRHNGGFRLRFKGADMKAGNRLEYDLPYDLAEAMETYLQEARPLLCSHQSCAALWIGANGQPFGRDGIEAMIRRRTKTRFGRSFGPHAFRHALATSAINLRPSQPGLAAAILGNSHQVVERSYARADRVVAGQDFVATIANLRATLPDLSAEW